MYKTLRYILYDDFSRFVRTTVKKKLEHKKILSFTQDFI